jgi:hypothetical protein
MARNESISENAEWTVMIGECFVLVSGHQLGNSEFSGTRNLPQNSVNGIMHGCCRYPYIAHPVAARQGWGTGHHRGLTMDAPLGCDEAGPERHSLRDLISGYAADDSRTIKMMGGTSNMSDPLGCRDQRIELRGVAFNEEEPVQVASVCVEEHGIESLNRTLLLQAAKVLYKFLEVLGADLFPSRN